MKKTIAISICAILHLTIYSQKHITVGDKALVIKGENILSYDELGLYGTETDWVEIYVYNTADSLIVTELQTKTSTTSYFEAVFIYAAKKSDLNLDQMSIVPNNMIKKPEGYLKLVIETKGLKELIISDSYYGKSYLAMKIANMRIIVKDNAQAKEIIAQIKK